MSVVGKVSFQKNKSFEKVQHANTVNMIILIVILYYVIFFTLNILINHI